MSFPTTQTALVQEVYAEPLTLKTIPVPTVHHGSALIRTLYSGVASYAREIYNGTRHYSYEAPIVPGFGAIGRIAALGPDATYLKEGQLVYADGMIHSRDNPDDIVLCGLTAGATSGAQKLMRETWHNGTWAEYVRVPLENVFPLNEEKLSGLGYAIEELATLTKYLAYGGLRDIDVRAGETVVVAPATGAFGGAAVAVCIALGARVIAMGRNKDALEALESTFGRNVKTVKITADVAHDVAALKSAANGPIDAVFEVSPPEAAKSTHIKSCIVALRRGGRMSLMGGIREDYPIPLGEVMRKNLVLRGTWMYSREQLLELIKMVETGVLKIGKKGGLKSFNVFPFSDWEKAFDTASDNARWDATVLFTPL